MERQCQSEWIARRIRDSQELRNRRNLRFAVRAATAFGHVEKEIDPRPTQPTGKVPDRFQAYHIADDAQRVRYGVDRLRLVPLDVGIQGGRRL
jgi:hypothetical protein